MEQSYRTKQRAALLDAIASFDGACFTAVQLCAAAKGRGASVGIATVYRALARFEAEALVRKFPGENGSCSYWQALDDTADCHTHLHMKCLRCGALFHLDCREARALTDHIAEHHGFSLSDRYCVLYGHCRECLGGEHTSLCDDAVTAPGKECRK